MIFNLQYISTCTYVCLLLVTVNAQVKSSKRIEKPNAIFTKIGEIGAGVSYLRTSIPINITNYVLAARAFKIGLQQYFSPKYMRQTIRQVVDTEWKHFNATSFTISEFFISRETYAWTNTANIYVELMDDIIKRAELLLAVLPGRSETITDHVMELDAIQKHQQYTDKAYQKKFDFWNASLVNTSNNASSRKKRFAEVVGGVVAIILPALAATVLSKTLIEREDLAISRAKLNENQAGIEGHYEIQLRMDGEVDRIWESLAERKLELLINKMFSPTMLSAYLDSNYKQFSDGLLRIESAVDMAQLGRLSIKYLFEEQTLEIYNLARKTANYANMKLLINKPSDIHELSVTHYQDGTTVHLVLAIPMVPKDKIMTAYRMDPVPMLYHNNSWIMPHVQDDIYAVSLGKKRLSFTCRQQDLLDCRKVHEMYVCHKMTTFDFGYGSSCLGMLFSHNTEGIRQTCNFRIMDERNHVTSLESTKYLVHSVTNYTSTLLCTNGETQKINIVAGSNDVNVMSGCSLTLEDKVIHGAISIVTQDYLHPVYFDVSIDHFIPNPEVDVLPHWKAMQERGQKFADISKIKTLRANMGWKKYASNIPMSWTVLALLAAILYNGAFFAVLLIVKCKKHRSLVKSRNEVVSMEEEEEDENEEDEEEEDDLYEVII